uniref:HMG box domain-containing protein n=1 Tax=Pyramimonas orientalis virus TaxID=455367 RepID=A0A7M3UP90_POV01|nr:hypothetical protein HWQ62_00432 [Pyramimonas orientalis virus]
MATTTYMTSMLNCFNDMKRDTLNEVLKTLESKDLLTDEIQEALTSMITLVKANKKVKKVSKPRFSGYHLFMKEHRAVVKAEQPDIKPQELTSVVAKAWKDVADDLKKDFNDRAAKMKEEHASNTSDNDSTDDEEKKVPAKKVPAKKVPAKKEPAKKEPAKKEKKVTEKKEKKVTEKKENAPVVDDDDDVEISIENADSDIDL